MQSLKLRLQLVGTISEYVWLMRLGSTLAIVDM
jgi:hypothetical protein